MSPLAFKSMRPIMALGAGIALFLVFFSLWNRRPAESTTKEIQPLQPNIRQSLDRLVYTETRGDRTILRIRASKYEQSADGKQVLKDIDSIHYGEKEGRQDSIQSESVIHDPSSRTTDFRGKVRILSQEGTLLTTSSMMYFKEEEVARSSEPFQFEHPRFKGRGRGFVYDFKSGLLHIQEEARFDLQEEASAGGKPPGDPIRIQSHRAVLTRDYQLDFLQEAEIAQGPYVLAAERIHLSLGEGGHSIQEMLGDRGARFEWSGEKEKQSLESVAMELKFDPEKNELRSIEAREQAVLRTSSQEKKGDLELRSTRIGIDLGASGMVRRLQAGPESELGQSSGRERVWMQGGNLEIDFFPGRSEPREVRCPDPAKIRFLNRDHLMEMWAGQWHGSFQDTPGMVSFGRLSGQGNVVAKKAPAPPEAAALATAFELNGLASVVSDTLTARKLEVDFYPRKRTPLRAYATGGCRLESRSFGEPTVPLQRVISAREFRVHFPADQANADWLDAGPEVIMEESFPKGKRRAEGQALHVVFNPADGQMETMQMSGAFRMEQEDVRVVSESALYRAAEEKWEILGHPRIWDAEGSTSAQRVDIFRKGERLKAEGEVQSIFPRKKGPAEAASLPVFGDSAAPLLISAELMEVDRAGKTIRYSRKAKASSGSESIGADQILFHQENGNLQATGGVRTVLYRLPEQEGAPARLVTAFGDRLDYSSRERTLEYAQNVTLVSEEFQIRAPHLKAYLNEKGDTLSRMDAWGGVRLTRNGMQGEGEECNYDALRQRIRLTGKPAVVRDPARGRTVGSRLTLTIPGDKIFVES